MAKKERSLKQKRNAVRRKKQFHAKRWGGGVRLKRKHAFAVDGRTARIETMCHHEEGFCRAQKTRREFLAVLRSGDSARATDFAVAVKAAANTQGNAVGACRAEMLAVADAAHAQADYWYGRQCAELLEVEANTDAPQLVQGLHKVLKVAAHVPGQQTTLVL